MCVCVCVAATDRVPLPGTSSIYERSGRNGRGKSPVNTESLPWGHGLFSHIRRPWRRGRRGRGWKKTSKFWKWLTPQNRFANIASSLHLSVGTCGEFEVLLLISGIHKHKSFWPGLSGDIFKLFLGLHNWDVANTAIVVWEWAWEERGRGGGLLCVARNNSQSLVIC